MTEFSTQHHVEGEVVECIARPRGISPPTEHYVPHLHNPQENVRPGADDHKAFKSLPAQGHATYHRGHV